MRRSIDSALKRRPPSAQPRPGLVVGTAAYMSPEQARGDAVDKRTDIWAFGCVLFEMLSGRRPFDAETSPQTLARVLEREPQWAALPPDTPPAIRTLLERCLRKDPEKRLHDIADARIEIDECDLAPAADAKSRAARWSGLVDRGRPARWRLACGDLLRQARRTAARGRALRVSRCSAGASDVPTQIRRLRRFARRPPDRRHGICRKPVEPLGAADRQPAVSGDSREPREPCFHSGSRMASRSASSRAESSRPSRFAAGCRVSCATLPIATRGRDATKSAAPGIATTSSFSCRAPSRSKGSRHERARLLRRSPLWRRERPHIAGPRFFRTAGAFSTSRCRERAIRESYGSDRSTAQPRSRSDALNRTRGIPQGIFSS